MTDDIRTIKNEIALNKALIFIGTGVSIYTIGGDEECSYWTRLLKHGLQRCYELGRISEKDLIDFNDRFGSSKVDIDDYIRVANEIKCCSQEESMTIENDVFQIWLTETIGQLSVRNSELIKFIGELQCPILTTNIDLLLEDVLDKKPLTWNQYCDLVTDGCLENLNEYIVHMNGYFKEPNSVIFSSENYNRFCQDRNGRHKLSALIRNKTLLFIGYDRRVFELDLSNLLTWIFHVSDQQQHSMYKFVPSNINNQYHIMPTVSFLDNIKEIQYGNTAEDLLLFIKDFTSFKLMIRDSFFFTNEREHVRMKYLNYLIKEYGQISILGCSSMSINLPLEEVYVELKFDPTHPSIKAMKTLEINAEFNRRLSSHNFFTRTEMENFKQTFTMQVFTV